MKKSLLPFAMLGLMALSMSCKGSIGAIASTGAAGATATGAAGAVGSGSTGGAGSTIGTGPGTAGTGTTVMPPPVGKPPTPEAAGTLALRRLTSREYDNTVADLLGDTTRPAGRFPVDGPSNSGFEAPVNVSPLHAQYYEETAGILADGALAANKLTIPCTNPTASTEATCATQFIQQFGRRAFRRPLTTTEQTDLRAIFTAARGLAFDFRQSLGHVVRAMLQHPAFLYHWEVGPMVPAASNGVVALSPHQIASRLSYFLWESMPDEPLLAAADANQLGTEAQVEAQAMRMLGNARAQNLMENFHVQWLFINNLADLQKDTTRYPLYNDGVRQALGAELRAFTSGVITGTGDGTLKTLLTAPFTFAPRALAPIYGVTAGATDLARVDLNPAQRAGILTQPAFLATNALPGESNPIYRGLAVFKQLLCGTVPSPPANVPEVEPPAANLSTRERYDVHGMNPCAGCHVAFDNFGFAFENYDAVGAYRTMDGGKPVDATGTVKTPGGATLTFNNAIDLANALAGSDEVKWCATRQWFRYVLGRPEQSTEQGSIELAYRQAAMNPGFSLRDLLIASVKSMTFRFRTVSPGEPI